MLNEHAHVRSSTPKFGGTRVWELVFQNSSEKLSPVEFGNSEICDNVHISLRVPFIKRCPVSLFDFSS